MKFNEDDQIQHLLQLSGSRPDVPDEVFTRVRSAVHSQWKKTVRTKMWNRRIMICFATSALVLSVYALALHFLNREYPLAIGLVENISGDVFVVPEKGSSHLLEKGEMLVAGSRLETGDGGRILLRLSTGASIRMDLRTLLRFTSESAFFIERGGVYLDTHRKKVKIALSTPFGTITNQGTQFEVRVDQRIVRVRVREGSVLLERNGIPKTAGAGTELAIDRKGRTTTGNTPGYGPKWGWISFVAPEFHLEGHSLKEFLQWMAHENGWTIVFAEDEIKKNASKIILHGSISGVLPDEMLAAVLPTCSLKYNLNDGVLKISKEDPK
ncbi:FecR domain-containing protein [bacterium]|nr:FecR domain-containing protein [bacterium]